MPTQALGVASDAMGTSSHAPETESREVTPPASGIGIQGPSIRWQTPTSIHFWKAHGQDHLSATRKRGRRPVVLTLTAWKWPKLFVHKPDTDQWILPQILCAVRREADILGQAWMCDQGLQFSTIFAALCPVEALYPT